MGNKELTHFDALIIGSGAGGGAAAEVLTRNGLKVLVLEAGPNYFSGLDDPDPKKMSTEFSNDDLKIKRYFIHQDPVVEPRVFRIAGQSKNHHIGMVNNLPKAVGGGMLASDAKMPRFLPWDFELGTRLKEIPGASFADWPLCYDELEPFYTFIEKTVGVQGESNSSPFDPPRSEPFPMPPGALMYSSEVIAKGASKLGYHPFPYPSAVNSREYDGRESCVYCGYCSNQVCPTGSKGSPAVTTLRHALLTGNCQLLPETKVVKLLHKGRNEVTGVQAIDADGSLVTYTADRYILAASPIESTRLLFLSDRHGPGLGNSSGMVGRNLMFHFQTEAVGVFDIRLHSHRGRVVDMGILDFRGYPGDPNRPLGGIIEFAGTGLPLREAQNYVRDMGMTGSILTEFLRQSPFRDRLAALEMQGEDAPQLTNTVELDPHVKDSDGIPVPRINYASHKFELSASAFYAPKMVDILIAAGAKHVFSSPPHTVPTSRHILGTMRFGPDPKTSVCDRSGRFHDVDNLYVVDGSLFPTGSGVNPLLTIEAVAARCAAAIVNPQSPEQAIRKQV